MLVAAQMMKICCKSRPSVDGLFLKDLCTQRLPVTMQLPLTTDQGCWKLALTIKILGCSAAMCERASNIIVAYFYNLLDPAVPAELRHLCKGAIACPFIMQDASFRL